jgi:hypothetical protein
MPLPGNAAWSRDHSRCAACGMVAPGTVRGGCMVARHTYGTAWLTLR